MPLRHLSVRWAVGYTSMELRKEVWDRDSIPPVDK